MKKQEFVSLYGKGKRNFEKQDFKGFSFKDMNLSNTNFSNSDIRGANFKNAILKGAIFSGADIGQLPIYSFLSILLLYTVLVLLGYGIYSVCYHFSKSLSLFELPSVDIIDRCNFGLTWVSFLTFVVAFYRIYGRPSGIFYGDLFNSAFVASFQGYVGSFFACLMAVIPIFRLVGIDIDTNDFYFFGIISGSSFGLMSVIFSICFYATFVYIDLIEEYVHSIFIVLIPLFTPIILIAFTDIEKWRTISHLVLLYFLIAVSFFIIRRRPVIANAWGKKYFIPAKADDDGSLWVELESFSKGSDGSNRVTSGLIGAFASIGRTNFFNADLTDANFTSAKIRLGDIRKANLTRTCFYEITGSGFLYISETLLETYPSNVLSLQVTGQGEGRDFEGANMSGISLKNANLRNANLNNANLQDADLSGSDISSSSLCGASLKKSNLSHVNLSQSTLINADFRHATFNYTDLSYTNLDGQDFCDQDMTGTNLSYSSLVKTQFLSTNLEKAVLTGACIQDWNINSASSLEEILCDYVFLKSGGQERRPSSGNFSEGEFSKLFNKALETVDLIFSDGVNWNAFFSSFQELRSKYNNQEISIQAIEKKSGGAFVIRLEVPAAADKSEIEEDAKRWYKKQLNIIKNKYEECLKSEKIQANLYSEQLKLQQENNTNLLEIVKTMVNRESSRQIHLNTGNYIESNSGTYVQGNYLGMSQDLAQAAAQIQKLLDQLQNQGVNVDTAQEQVAKGIAKEAQDNKAVREKLVVWGKSLGDATITDVVKGVVKLSLRSAGLPLP